MNYVRNYHNDDVGLSREASAKSVKDLLLEPGFVGEAADQNTNSSRPHHYQLQSHDVMNKIDCI